MNNEMTAKLLSDSEILADTDFARQIIDLDTQMHMLSSHADKSDYVLAAASGVLCGMLDVLWVGDFDLYRGREFAGMQIDSLVEKTAKLLGNEKEGIGSAVAFLEKFHIPSDGNTPDFGGGLQHHLRDFAHHPTIVGLIFSLLTQFTGKSYGTDVKGNFLSVPVPEKSMIIIGKTIPEKMLNGTITWFFHLVSDMAGSSGTAGITGGTGIPGPVLSLAKEISVLPPFKNITVGDNALTVFLSKLFNGTLLAQHDEKGNIIKGTQIKIDLRGELGVALEIGRQALPVIANECLVRVFYFIKALFSEIKTVHPKTLSDLDQIDFSKVKPWNNPTLDRILTVATGVFTAIDVADAVLTKKYFVAVNYVGIARFAIAVSNETINYLKIHDVKKIKKMYEKIQENTYSQKDNGIYRKIGENMNIDKFGLTLEQVEILYNIEMFKVKNDITQSTAKRALKTEWLDEWKHYMELGFSDFTGVEGATLHWYETYELMQKISSMEPEKTWFRLVLLEAMVFEPYYALSLEKDKKGKEVPSKKYNDLALPWFGYNRGKGDEFLNSFFLDEYYKPGYIPRLRKTYNQMMLELNEVVKGAVKTIAITALVTVTLVFVAGAFAPTIAVALVGSNFSGLSGAALTSACLAYLGGGAVAAGGAGMAGGTLAIVGGGALLGIGVGTGVGGSIGAIGVLGKKAVIQQSAKLMVSVREIFLNDEHDIEYSNSVYEQYVRNIAELEKDLVELRLKADVAEKEEKKTLMEKIKNIEDSVHAMKIAMKSMKRFNSSFKNGLSDEE